MLAARGDPKFVGRIGEQPVKFVGHPRAIKARGGGAFASLRVSIVCGVNGGNRGGQAGHAAGSGWGRLSV